MRTAPSGASRHLPLDGGGLTDIPGGVFPHSVADNIRCYIDRGIFFCKFLLNTIGRELNL